VFDLASQDGEVHSGRFFRLLPTPDSRGVGGGNPQEPPILAAFLLAAGLLFREARGGEARAGAAMELRA
jgi:hypothetical protein